MSQLYIDPSVNPAVTDTLTWRPSSAVKSCANQMRQIEAYVSAIVNGGSAGEAVHAAMDTEGALEFSLTSATDCDYGTCALVRCPDNQRLFVCAGNRWAQSPWAANAIANWDLLGCEVRAVPVDMGTMRTYLKDVAPGKGPSALQRTPRLGIGSRQSVSVWPGVFEAVSDIGVPSEVIQSSAYREMAPMDKILSPPDDETTYLPGHGSLEIGHTGSSVEGLWLWGVVTALELGFDLPYGADLDHIPIGHDGAAGMERAKWIVDAGRDYTFFTLDASGLFNEAALVSNFSHALAAYEDAVPVSDRAALMSAHSSRGLTRARIVRLAAMYYRSVSAAVEIFSHIGKMKHGESFDFEFSLDEGSHLTDTDELTFVLEELSRRGVRVDFIAPNVGFEKRRDYRLPDGLPGLEERVRSHAQVAAEYGALLDFHSASDKSTETYRCISKAAGGNFKLKVSGKLQLLLAETVADLDPQLFEEWWDWTIACARSAAERGSRVAAEYVGLVEARMTQEGEDFRRSPKDRFFTDFAFGMVGARDEAGQFIHRHKFYSLPRSVQQEYAERVRRYLLDLANDLGFGH